MGSLNQGVIQRITYPDLPLPIQRKIAAVLSAYDDLIEKNNRRIALLEKMGEELYREWFVRLRFPGHESTKIVKGVPEGWEVKRIGEILTTSSGGTPNRGEFSNYGGAINWFKTGELKQMYIFDSEEKISESGVENSSAKIFPAGTVVMAMYCAMDNVSILGKPSATNQACCAFLPKHNSTPSLFTYYLIKFNITQLIAYAHGAAQQNLSQDLIKKHRVFLPQHQIIKSFSDAVSPIHDQIMGLLIQQTNLATTRDRLLTRLMSGKIDLESLDIAFPPSMQEAA